ncbi:hypothetical protein MJO28_017913 [Puccinia striiformis f. sp. tritici]|nr:hypothetical protein MJO28_017913 [Puccinia striiformis f. sp. tritici]
MDNPKARDKHLPAINPLIDSMDQEFCQQNPSCQFDQDTPDRSMYDPGHPCCIVPTTELTKLWAMMNLDNEHYEQALQILCMPGGPISFLVMKELERHQEKSNNRGKSSDPPWDNQPKLKDFGAAIPQEFRVQQGFEITLVRNIQTHVWCLIHKKLLEGVLDSEGDIAPGLVLPRLNEITQVIFQFLSPNEAGMSEKRSTEEDNNSLYWLNCSHSTPDTQSSPPSTTPEEDLPVDPNQ